jgi:hypothetical protein
VVHTVNDQAEVTVTQERWDKTRAIIRRVKDEHEAMREEKEGESVSVPLPLSGFPATPFVRLP